VAGLQTLRVVHLRRPALRAAPREIAWPNKGGGGKDGDLYRQWAGRGIEPATLTEELGEDGDTPEAAVRVLVEQGALDLLA
jgi:hypothetical protein